MNAVGYFLDDGRRHNVPGLAEQNRLFLDYCSRQGYDVAATFLDSRESAPRRPGFEQMLEYLQRPEKGFMEVVICNLNVLGDDLTTAARNLMRIDHAGARIQCLKAERDGFAALMEAWAKRADAPDISERVRLAMRRKAVKGEVLGRPPYGYKVGPKRRLELVPEEAQVVRYIFRLYIQEGLGIRLIARRLNEDGTRTRRGGNWSMVSIRDILRNRTYLGTYTRFGVRVPGTHPALVTPEDFKLAQDRMEARRGVRTPRQVSPFLLSGLAFCGRCGNRMIGVSRRQRWKRRSDGGESEGQYRYYQCESRTNQSLCEYNTQRALDLEERVRDELCRLRDSDAPGIEGNAREQLEIAGEAERIKQRIGKLNKQVDQQFTSLAKGLTTFDRLREEATALALEQAGLEGRLRELEMEANREASAAQRVATRKRKMETLCVEWDDLPFEERQSLLREVLQTVTVVDHHLEVRLR